MAEDRISGVARLILELAKRDLVGGVGRVLVGDLELRGYRYEEVLKALELLRSRYDVAVVGNVIKVKFA